MLNLIEIPNLIDVDYQKQLYNTVTDVEFPWHYLEDTTYENSSKPTCNTPAFTHLLFNNNGTKSKYLDVFTPMFLEGIDRCNLKLISTIRFRLGFLLKTRYNIPSMPYAHNTPHIDCEGDHYTAIYYLNTTDGDTYLFNETEQLPKYSINTRIRPEAGKFICFNGRHYHASSCPKMFPSRIVLTMNFTAEEK